MDESRTVSPHVRLLTVNLDHDDVELFEGLWPVPHGVALHAYVITGSRSVIVDPWDAGGYGPEEVEADLLTLGLSWKDLAVAFTQKPADDLETRLRAFHPGLESWGLPTPGARHDLGLGVVLEERGGFWFVSPDGVALTGDTFSGLGWMEEELWSEDLNENEARWFDDEALRWFSSRPLVPKALPVATHVVAPRHGCLWGRKPEEALERSRRFQAWGEGPALDEVTVVWPAEGASDQVDALVGGILDTGAGLTLLRIPGDEATALAAGARRASLVVVASGLNEEFLKGVEKEVWRPDSTTPADSLRKQIADRIQAVRERSRR